MIGIEDHLEGNGGLQEITEVHQVDLEVDEVEEGVGVLDRDRGYRSHKSDRLKGLAMSWSVHK